MEKLNDPLTVKKTLKFLVQNLRTEQFSLKTALKVKKQAEFEEQEVRRRIKGLKNRIQLEIDNNIELLRGFDINSDNTEVD